MKNKYILMIVCVLLACPVLIADEGFYFPEGKQWIAVYVEQDGSYCGGKPVCSILGDTTIADLKYHVLTFSNYDEHYAVPIRECDKKIYARITDMDVLLYDFGAEVGDSVPNNYIQSLFGESGLPVIEQHGYMHIIKTDSVLLLNGQKAKRQFYDNFRSEDIEYIGCAKGVLSHWGYPPTPTCLGVQFNFCCSQNGEPLYEYNPGDCERMSALPINTVQADVFCATKIFQNGQLLIERNDKTYTLTGIETK